MEDLSAFVNLLLGIINPLLFLLVGLSLLVFFKGLVTFISNSGDAGSHEEGKKLMIWGVVALFVMVSFLGILQLFYSDLGFGAVKPFGLPLLPTE